LTQLIPYQTAVLRGMRLILVVFWSLV
jgi:hypothetical protein